MLNHFLITDRDELTDDGRGLTIPDGNFTDKGKVVFDEAKTVVKTISDEAKTVAMTISVEADGHESTHDHL